MIRRVMKIFYEYQVGKQDEAKKKVEEHFNPKMKKSSLDQFF